MVNRQELENILNQGQSVFLGVVSLEKDLVSYTNYEQWLLQKNHAGMDYMQNHKDIRLEPAKLLPGAKSCLVLAYNYNLGDKISDLKNGPLIAQYARLKDYHKFLKRIGTRQAEELKKIIPGLDYRVTVDSAPLLEKALAAKTSLGFIGKNSLYIHPKLGSLFFLYEILLSVDLDFDAKELVDPKTRSESLGGCGSCKRCVTFCPTGALDQEYVIDARKCLSYYTIEHRGIIPLQYWSFLEKYLYGCDICQLVCPYNRQSQKSDTPYESLLKTPDLFAVATMDQDFYEQTFGGTPMTRAKKYGLQRNALIALVVTQNPRLDEAIQSIKQSNPHESLLDTIRQIPKFQKSISSKK